MDDVECPYCGESFEIEHDGGAYYQEDHGVETECPHCEKYFLVYASCSWYYEGHKADCLNGAEHQWEDEYSASTVERIPTLKGRQQCKVCEDKRQVKVEEA